MDLKQAIASRRAVRAYTPEPVDEAQLRALIALAVEAPSAMNRQPWSFCIVRDPAVLQRISDEAKQHLARLLPDTPHRRRRGDAQPGATLEGRRDAFPPTQPTVTLRPVEAVRRMATSLLRRSSLVGEQDGAWIPHRRGHDKYPASPLSDPEVLGIDRPVRPVPPVVVEVPPEPVVPPVG